MTISTTASRIAYTGNGVTTAFSFPYRFFANTDLVVVKVSALGVETTLVLTTDYTVTGADLDAGGTVTCVVAPAVGERLVIYRDMDYTQEVDYTSGDSFPAETHERALDRLTMLTQQIKDAADRSVKVSETSTITPDELVDSINDAVIAAAASATAADASADDAAASATAADASANAAAASAASINPTSLLTKAGNLSGLTSTATARSNLGLVIGTDVLAPNGDGSGLTGFEKIAQRVVVETQSLGSTTAVIPYDDSIPQITEGDLWLSTSFTPTNAASSIYVTAGVPVWQSTSTQTAVMGMLFTSESTDAKALCRVFNGPVNPFDSLLFLKKKLNGWTGARTVSIRVGVSSANLTYINGRTTPNSLGRKDTSYLEIIEVLP